MKNVERYNQTRIRYATDEVADMWFVNAQEFDRVTAERDALQLLLNERDEHLHSLAQRRYAEQQACQAAERRVEALITALADPVPSAGGEVEALGYIDHASTYYPSLESVETYGQGRDVRELVDRAHVTRLQAELKTALEACDDYGVQVVELRAEVERLKRDLHSANVALEARKRTFEHLQSELTKARELLREWMTSNFTGSCPERNDLRCRTDYALSNQSAPADKTGQTCVVRRYERDVTGHSDVEVHASGLVHYDHGPNLAEALARLAGRVARFHKLEAPSLAEQPAPVAVVMPKRMPGDEVARLNGLTK